METFLNSLLPEYLQFFEWNDATRVTVYRLVFGIGGFAILVALSLLLGRATPRLARFIVRRFSQQRVAEIYDQLIEPIAGVFRWTGALILIAISLNFLRLFPRLIPVYVLLKFFSDLAVIISVAWLISRLFRQFVRAYGIELIRKLGLEVDELLLVAEAVANAIIGFLAALIFAQSQQVNLVGLLASVGIGGLAIAFAAQKTLEQLLGTAVLYLDRPFTPGEYIRMADTFGRVESIGIRSTKIRTAAKSTLLIVPNSVMANAEIENVTRGKKVMVMLYLDFPRQLVDREKALVEEIVQQSTDTLYGIDPGSTRVRLETPEASNNNGSSPPVQTRARVTFFILGSSDNSIQLRKRLLELANEKISKELLAHDIQFTTDEPTIYVESPMTI